MKKNVNHHQTQLKNVAAVNSKFNLSSQKSYLYFSSSKKHRDEPSDDEESRHRRRRERSSSD